VTEANGEAGMADVAIKERVGAVDERRESSCLEESSS